MTAPLPPIDPAHAAIIADARVRRTIEAKLRVEGVGDADAEEIGHDVLIELLRASARPANPLEASRLAWKATVNAISRFRAKFKRRKKYNMGLTDAPEEHGDARCNAADATKAVERAEAMDALRELVRRKKITPADLQLLAMKGMEHEDQEIAFALHVDVDYVRQRSTKLRKKWLKAFPSVAAFAFLVVVSYFAWKKHQEEAHPPPAPHLDDLHQVAPTPAPPSRAETLRSEGVQACEASDWATCLAKLDAAKALDPAGDDTDLMADWRAKVFAETHPGSGDGKPHHR